VDEFTEIMKELQKIKSENLQLLSGLSNNSSQNNNKKDEDLEFSDINLTGDSSETLVLDEEKLLKKILELEQKQTKFEKVLTLLSKYNKEKIEKIEKQLEIISKALVNPLITLLKTDAAISKEIKSLNKNLNDVKNKTLNLEKNINDLMKKTVETKFNSLEQSLKNLEKKTQKDDLLVQKVDQLLNLMDKFVKNQVIEIKLINEQSKKVLENEKNNEILLKDLEKKVLLLIEELDSIKKILLSNSKPK
jgi:hypothetical protein